MKRIGILLSMALLLVGCAKMLTPSGGPKDTTPPSVLQVLPRNQASNFKDKTIKITFDEYVVLNNATENTIFSPPLQYPPEFSLSHKSLLIRIEDTLKPNTTYNVVLTDAVKDFTEGNKLALYQYTFSTGETIDTFMYCGKLQDAQTLEPVPDCFVFLYQNDVDSLPLTTRPDYVTKTMKNGTFVFTNIAEGCYKLFALQDVNKDFLFNLPNEAIAFSDTMVCAVSMPPRQTDTVPQAKKRGTAKPKTVENKDGKDVQPNKSKREQTTMASDSAKLPTWSLFLEKDTVYALLKVANPTLGVYQLAYRSEVRDCQFVPLDTVKFDRFERWNTARDTVTLYAKNIPADTVRFEVVADSHRDTIALAPYKKPKQSRGRGKKPATEIKFGVKADNMGEIYKDLELEFSYPVRPADSCRLWVIKKKKNGNDTSSVTVSVPDSFVTRLAVPLEKEEKVPYQVMIPDSVFFAYNGTTHDTLRFDFVMKSEKDYGDLVMNYEFKERGNYIVTLSSAQGELVRTDILRESARVTYPNLLTGSYKVKVIDDRNGNGQWDTGSYYEKRQPEPIYHFTKTLNVRGYWELEETFEVDNEK